MIRPFNILQFNEAIISEKLTKKKLRLLQVFIIEQSDTKIIHRMFIYDIFPQFSKDIHP